MLDRRWVEAFLHYGYLPVARTDLQQETWATAERNGSLEGLPEEQLISRGIDALRSAFQGIGRGRQVVLLSGGLDSRAILAELLLAIPKEDIFAVTFGCPGTLDYEIGRSVAQNAGVDCEAIDLRQVEISQETVETTVREGGKWTYLFEAALGRSAYRSLGGDCTYWTGFMGDPLAGSHLQRRESMSWDEARRRFARRNRFVTSTRATSRHFDPETVLPAGPLLKDSLLSYDEQLDFGIRQQSCIKPLVVPVGYECRTPFLHPVWVSFVLNLPREHRYDQRLYGRILRKAHPNLFSLPTKGTFGLDPDANGWQRAWSWLRMGLGKRLRLATPFLRWPVYPLANYLDFGEALRVAGGLQSVVRDNVTHLARRGIVDWLDVELVWQRHQRRLADHADLLLTLAALEVNLMMSERQ